MGLIRGAATTYAVVRPPNRHLAKEERDICAILSLTRSPIFKFAVDPTRRTNMKPKKLKKKIQELEKRLREGPDKLARLRRKLQQAESAKALKAARKSAARASAKKASATKKPKRKLNLSPERRAQLAAAMKARWAARRAAEGGHTTSTDHNSPTPPTQGPENRGDGV